jgi:hypothetical protein
MPNPTFLIDREIIEEVLPCPDRFQQLSCASMVVITLSNWMEEDGHLYRADGRDTDPIAHVRSQVFMTSSTISDMK